MKKIYSTLLVLSVIFAVNAQDRASLTYEEATTYEIFKNIKKGKLESYTSKNGTILKVGDTILLGEPYNADSNYASITLGDTSGKSTGGVVGFMNNNADKETPLVPLDAKYKGQEVTIVKMRHDHDGSKKKPIIVRIAIDPLYGAFGLNSKSTIKNVEDSLEKREILHSSTPIDRELAVAMLKEAKEEFDLGILSEGEFQQKKEDLLKIIRAN